MPDPTIRAGRFARVRRRRGGVRTHDRGLGSSDIDLIAYVCRFCAGHSDRYIAHEVFSLPAPARGALGALLEQLDNAGSLEADAAFHAKCAVGDDLHAWARKWGCGRRIADAFLMPYEAWRTVHTMPGRGR